MSVFPPIPEETTLAIVPPPQFLQQKTVFMDYGGIDSLVIVPISHAVVSITIAVAITCLRDKPRGGYFLSK